jgi:hypothetical protein
MHQLIARTHKTEFVFFHIALIIANQFICHDGYKFGKINESMLLQTATGCLGLTL